MAEDWVVAATENALTAVQSHGAKVGLSNTEEFTFRSFWMSAAVDLLPDVLFQTEWHKFDLLVQTPNANMLVEFKYYLSRQTYDLERTPGNIKGGPGAQNEAEFYACLRKLRATAHPGITARRLVLVYGDTDERVDRIKSPTRKWSDTYGALGQGAEIAHVWSVSGDPLHAKVIEPTELLAPS